MSDTSTIHQLYEELKCRQCGAILVFKPGTRHLVCEYCGSDNEIESRAAPIVEINYEHFVHQNLTEAATYEVRMSSCKSCGATISVLPNITSDSCPFCDTPWVEQNASSLKLIRPQGVLPFAIAQKEAYAAFKKWLATLWFAPNALLQKAVDEDKLKGIYIPYWTYDAATNSSYTGLRGDEYRTYETQMVQDANGKMATRQVPIVKIRWFSVSGRVNLCFDDVLVVASTSLPTEYVDYLEPFDLENLEPYSEKFLSGFRTESYRLNVRDGLHLAKQKMDVLIQNAVRQDIGGDQQRIQNLQTTYQNLTFKHILLPIWVSAYRYNNKVYRFIINGRTGKVQGERPYSAIKIAAAVLLVLSIMALFVYIQSVLQ